MTLASTIVRALPSSSKTLAQLVERLRTTELTFSLEETSSAARPYLLASISAALRKPLFVIVPTGDVAERTFADLLYYRNRPENDESETDIALLRPRGETIGAIESPSERSARMSLLSDLCDGTPNARIVVAPVAALRQFVVPRDLFCDLTFELESGVEVGWDATLRCLHRLGYHRVDVVSAVGEYAVRGGILDLFAATASRAARIEFFGDEVESIRPFDLNTQRSESDEHLETLRITPWSEIPRDPELRERVAERVRGAVDPERAAPGAVEHALRTFLDSGSELPEAWLSLAFEKPATLVDYLDDETVIVLEEPAMLAAVERSLGEERDRESRSLLRELDEDQLGVATSEIGDALLAEIIAPQPTITDFADRFKRRPCLVIPGAIEGEIPPWLPPVAERFVLETRPAEHFNRQITQFVESMRERSRAGDTVMLVVSGVSRVVEMLHAADLPVERSAKIIHLQARGGDGAKLASVGGRPIYVDAGSIDGGFSIPDMRMHVLGDREIFGQPPKRVKLRAVKEGVPVTLADLRVGDFVVHAVHGIGQYLGLRTETILGATSDYLDLKYAGTDRMLVPVHQMHQVTKYGAAEGAAPRLSKMGGADWARAKSRVSEALAKIARRARRTVRGARTE